MADMTFHQAFTLGLAEQLIACQAQLATALGDADTYRLLALTSARHSADLRRELDAAKRQNVALREDVRAARGLPKMHDRADDAERLE